MESRQRLLTGVLAVAALVAAPRCACVSLVPHAPPDPICAEAPYSPPPATFRDSDLVGTWEARYDAGIDRLTLKADGTFQQVYEERIAYVLTLYVYETPWNRWSTERSPDGRVRVHLQGARYYAAGVSVAETDGMWYPSGPVPHLFVDPFTRGSVQMVRKLVLNLRVDSSGQLLLHHMFWGSDQAFPMSGCQQDQFRRLNTP